MPRSWKMINLKGPEIPEEDLDFYSYKLNELEFVRDIYIAENKLEKIDLEPLKVCGNLEDFTIKKTKLKEIDLTAIVDTGVKIIDLSSNRIRKIDLEPLESCEGLKKIFLQGNEIEEVDLEPLRGLKFLETVWVGYNKIKDIDLSAIGGRVKSIHCTTFRGMEEIDLRPVKENKRIEELYYSWEEKEGEEVELLMKEERRLIYRKKEYYYEEEGEINSRSKKVGEEEKVIKQYVKDKRKVSQEIRIYNEIYKKKK